MGAAKTASESRSKKRSQNSEAFLWMDESIKKKRKCKRGYDEKLGENSTLQTFSLRLPLNHPPASLGWGRIFLLFHFHDDGRGRAARETLEERIASRVMRENPTNAVPIDTVHTGDEGNKKRRNEAFPSLKLQLCETEAANHFLLITASAFSSVIEGKKGDRLVLTVDSLKVMLLNAGPALKLVIKVSSRFLVWRRLFRKGPISTRFKRSLRSDFLFELSQTTKLVQVKYDDTGWFQVKLLSGSQFAHNFLIFDLVTRYLSFLS